MSSKQLSSGKWGEKISSTSQSTVYVCQSRRCMVKQHNKIVPRTDASTVRLLQTFSAYLRASATTSRNAYYHRKIWNHKETMAAGQHYLFSPPPRNRYPRPVQMLSATPNVLPLVYSTQFVFFTINNYVVGVFQDNAFRKNQEFSAIASSTKKYYAYSANTIASTVRAQRGTASKKIAATEIAHPPRSSSKSWVVRQQTLIHIYQYISYLPCFPRNHYSLWYTE